VRKHLKKSKKDIPLVRLDRREWFFEKDCPKDEVYDCWLYEFSREVDWLKAAVARLRAQIATKHGKTVNTLSRLAEETFYTFLLMPQWPAKPYLSVSEEERHKWIMWTRRSELVGWTSRSELSQAAALLVDTPILLKSPLPSEIEDKILADYLVPREVPKGIEAQLAACLQNVGGPSLRRPRVRSKNNLMELALLLIDWGLPDSLLIRAFESYIKEFRPLVPNSLRIRHTGKSDPDSMRLRQLDQLGRFRLWRANGQNVESARQTGYLSASHHCWYRAQRAVTALLENAETQIIPLLSRVELENFRALNTPSKRE
jgi:hypothetical protein